MKTSSHRKIIVIPKFLHPALPKSIYRCRLLLLGVMGLAQLQGVSAQTASPDIGYERIAYWNFEGAGVVSPATTSDPNAARRVTYTAESGIDISNSTVVIEAASIETTHSFGAGGYSYGATLLGGAVSMPSAIATDGRWFSPSSTFPFTSLPSTSNSKAAGMRELSGGTNGPSLIVRFPAEKTVAGAVVKFTGFRLSFDYRFYHKGSGIKINWQTTKLNGDLASSPFKVDGDWGRCVLDLTASPTNPTASTFVEFKNLNEASNGSLLIDNVVVSGMTAAPKLTTGVASASAGVSISTDHGVVASDETHRNNADVGMNVLYLTRNRLTDPVDFPDSTYSSKKIGYSSASDEIPFYSSGSTVRTTLNDFLGLPTAIPSQTEDISITRELDLEGGTTLPRVLSTDYPPSVNVNRTRTYWIGSHSRNKAGKISGSHCHLFGIDFINTTPSGTATWEARSVDTTYTKLLRDLYYYGDTSNPLNSLEMYPEVQAQIAGDMLQVINSADFDVVRAALRNSITQVASNNTPINLTTGLPTDDLVPSLSPKVNGLSIEGLSATPSGDLMIGVRNPLIGPNQLALVLPFRLYGAGAEKMAKFTKPVLLNLGGRGIRSIEYDVEHKRFLIIGGNPRGGDNNTVIYTWNGIGTSTPVPFENANAVGFGRNANPEAIYPVQGTDDFLVASDDGDLLTNDGGIGGLDQKNRASGGQKYRSLRFNLPAPLNPQTFTAFYTGSVTNPNQTEILNPTSVAGAIGGTFQIAPNYPRVTPTNFTFIGSATRGVDYIAKQSGAPIVTAILPASALSTSVTVDFVSDNILEASETFGIGIGTVAINSRCLAGCPLDIFTDLDGDLLPGMDNYYGSPGYLPRIRATAILPEAMQEQLEDYSQTRYSGITDTGFLGYANHNESEDTYFTNVYSIMGNSIPQFSPQSSEIPFLSATSKGPYWYMGAQLSDISDGWQSRCAGNLHYQVNGSDHEQDDPHSSRAMYTTMQTGGKLILQDESSFSCVCDTPTGALVGGHTSGYGVGATIWKITDSIPITYTCQTLTGHAVIDIVPNAAIVFSYNPYGPYDYNNKLSLANTSGVFGVPIALPLGVFSSVNCSRLAKTSTGVTVTGNGLNSNSVCVPVFWTMANNSSVISGPFSLPIANPTKSASVVAISSDGMYLVGIDWGSDAFYTSNLSIGSVANSNFTTLVWKKVGSSYTLQSFNEPTFLPNGINTTGTISGVLGGFYFGYWQYGDFNLTYIKGSRPCQIFCK